MKSCSCRLLGRADEPGRRWKSQPGAAVANLALVALACTLTFAACSSARHLHAKADHQARLETFHRAVGNMMLMGDYMGAFALLQEMLFQDSTFIYLDDYQLLYQCGVRTGLVNTACTALHFGRWRATGVRDRAKRDATLSAFDGWLTMLRHRWAAGELTVVDAEMGALLKEDNRVFPCVPVGGVAAIRRRMKLTRGAQTWSGTVGVEATVDAKGRVVDCRVVAPLEPLIDQAVVEAVCRSPFFPAFVQGVPAGTTVLVQVAGERR